MQSEQINEIAKALAAAQAVIKNPPKNKTAKAGAYTYKYADIADVLDVVLPALSKEGICVSQPTVVDGDVLIVRTQLAHASGQWMISDYPVCKINGDHQKMGGALTYSRRYALCSMVGVAADDDSDGQGAAAAAAPVRRSSAQAKRDGGLEDLHKDLADCESAVSVDRLHKDYLRNTYPSWPKAWAEAADMQFDAKLAEFSTGDDLVQTLKDSAEIGPAGVPFRASDNIETKADYIRYAFDTIDDAKSASQMKEWYAKESAARTRFRLTREEAHQIIERMTARNEALKAEADDLA